MYDNCKLYINGWKINLYQMQTLDALSKHYMFTLYYIFIKIQGALLRYWMYSFLNILKCTKLRRHHFKYVTLGYVRRFGQTSRISRLWHWFSITSLAMEFMKTHLFLKFNWNSLVLYHSDLWVWKLKLFVCMGVWSRMWGWELFSFIHTLSCLWQISYNDIISISH